MVHSLGFLYSVLCCLKSDYYCSSEYWIDIDDFKDNLMPDSESSEVIKDYADIDTQARKIKSLFTMTEIESFPLLVLFFSREFQIEINQFQHQFFDLLLSLPIV